VTSPPLLELCSILRPQCTVKRPVTKIAVQASNLCRLTSIWQQVTKVILRQYSMQSHFFMEACNQKGCPLGCSDFAFSSQIWWSHPGDCSLGPKGWEYEKYSKFFLGSVVFCWFFCTFCKMWLFWQISKIYNKS